MEMVARLFPIAGVSEYPRQGSRCEGGMQPAEGGLLDTAPCAGHLLLYLGGRLMRFPKPQCLLVHRHASQVQMHFQPSPGRLCTWLSAAGGCEIHRGAALGFRYSFCPPGFQGLAPKEMCDSMSSQGPPSPDHILLPAARGGPSGFSSADLVL